MVSSMQEEVRYFVAKQDGKICAFLKISASGEPFVATGNNYRHITGAYCLPEHRGKGVYQNLLNFAISTLKGKGYTRLGANFESFNPTGRGFWLKYFAAYTNSVVRRIDERITQRRIYTLYYTLYASSWAGCSDNDIVDKPKRMNNIRNAF